MLRDRGAAQGAHEDPGIPRRPARHRHHRRRRDHQCAAAQRQEARGRQDRRLRRRRRGDRLPQSSGVDGRAAQEHLGLRHRRRRARRPQHADGPLEVGLCAEDRQARAGRRDRRRRHFSRPVGAQRADAGHGQGDGGQAAGDGAGQSDAGNHAGRSAQGAPRRDDLHRALRLSQPGQQRPVLSVHLPRRARCRRHRDQRGDEARRGRGDRAAGARSAVGCGRARLRQRRSAGFRPGLADPEPVRSAADPAHRAGGREGGDGVGRRLASDREFRRLYARSWSASRSAPASS